MAGVIPDVLADVVEKAKMLSEAPIGDNADAKLEDVLFPFFEALGYSATRVGDIVIAPVYAKDGQKHIDYGLVDFNPDSLKTVVTVIADSTAEKFDEGIRRSQECLDAIAPADKMMPGYLLITDCYSYTVFDVDARTKALRQVAVFDLRNLSPASLDVMKLICNPQSEATQWLVVRQPEQEIEPEEVKNEPDESIVPKKKTLSSVMVTLICFLICLVALIITIICCAKFSVFTGRWYKVTNNHTSVTLPLTELRGRSSALAQADGRLLYSLTDTNLPAKTTIAVICKTDTDTKTFTITVGDGGSVSAYLTIPNSWKQGNVSVSTELIFGADQCHEALKMFGNAGENIIGSSLGTVGYIITSTTCSLDKKDPSNPYDTSPVNPDNPVNPSYNDALKNCAVVLYSNGDIGIYPKGYSTDDWESNNDNITSTDKSYCKIMWSEANNKATLYYVAGTIMAQASWNRGVIMLSDGANVYHFNTSYGIWKWHINGFTSVTGWCRFDESGVADMIPILKAIYNTKQSTIEFKDLKDKRIISDKDRNAVLNIISVYETYFNTTSGKPQIVSYIQEH